MNKHAWGAAALLVLAGCGGGGSDDSSSSTASTPATAAAQLRSAMSVQQARPAAAASAADAAEQLLDFAEASFPAHFPVHQSTSTLDPFSFRHYPQTGVYVGVVVKPGMGYPMDGVYVMGGPFGEAPVHVGQLSDFITPADPGVGTGGTTGVSNGCYDLHLLEQPTTRITVTMDHTGLTFGTMTLDWTIRGVRSFGTNLATETVLKSTGGHIGGSSVDAEEKSYTSRSGDAAQIQYGSERTTVADFGGTLLTVIETVQHTPPTADLRYGLAVGESFTRQVSSTVTKSTSFSSKPTVTTSSRNEEETVRFVAIERITVPAGTYDTCRFESRQASAPDVVNTTWVIQGKGIPVKVHSKVNGIEMDQWATSVILNGRPL